MSYRKSKIFGKLTAEQKQGESPFAQLDAIKITDPTPTTPTVVPPLKIDSELSSRLNRFPWITELDQYLAKIEVNQGFDIPIGLIKGDVPDKRGAQPSAHPRIRQFDSCLRSYIHRKFPEIIFSVRCKTVNGLFSKQDQGAKLESLRVIRKERAKSPVPEDTPVDATAGSKKINLNLKSHLYTYLVSVSSSTGMPLTHVIYQFIEDRMDGKR
tara:strand:+ start:1034 stop:1669 length:636 start_codon:yes stop_codon:yes gene_type:complete